MRSLVPVLISLDLLSCFLCSFRLFTCDYFPLRRTWAQNANRTLMCGSRISNGQERGTPLSFVDTFFLTFADAKRVNSSSVPINPDPVETSRFLTRETMSPLQSFTITILNPPPELYQIPAKLKKKWFFFFDPDKLNSRMEPENVLLATVSSYFYTLC